MDALTLQSIGFRRGHRSILNDVSWTIPRGSHAAILGPNGGGKSTLLRILTGYYFPSDGSVDLLGHRIGNVNLDTLRRRIGLVDPGSPYPIDSTMRVLEVVLSGFFGHLCLHFDEPDQQQIDGAREALANVGMGDRAEQYFETLSTGEQRRVLLARAMVHHPELLILDEPTSGLDLLARETLLATLDALLRRRPELTLLMVTHHLEELLPSTDNILLVARGVAVAKGRPAEVLQEGPLQTAFGCPVEVRQDRGRWSWSVHPGVWETLIDEQKRGGNGRA